MTVYHPAMIARMVAQTTSAQGVPLRVADAQVLRSVAALLAEPSPVS